MKSVITNILLLVCFNVILQIDSQVLRKEVYMSVPKLITAAGYPSEKHRVTTLDGYTLQMHRIPAGRRTARRSDTGGKGKKAVFVQHGMMGSSGDFVIMGPERSLAFLLADAGYDVWLGNFRGNVYSRHRNLTRNDPAFWDYSIHEHGKYDLPSMIDKVLNVTGLEKVLYVGYSMGTSSFFTMMAQRPEYNEKIVAFVALAPAVYLNNVRSLATVLLKTVNLPQTMQERGLLSATFPQQLLEFIFGSLCTARNPSEDMCLTMVYSLVGEDYEQNDWSWVVSAILVIQLAQGMSLGFSSALLPALQTQDFPIVINLETSSWIVASLSLGCVVCFPTSLFLLSTFGRRPTIMMDMVPGIIGCLLIYFANNVTALISGRFLSGLAIGSSAVAAAISTGEYTSPAYRGVFLNLKNATLYVGCTVVHILGHYLHWRTVALTNAVTYTLAFFMAYTWPESPSKLAEKKDFVRCVKTFYWLRGESQESTTELEEMIRVQRKKPTQRTLVEGCMMFLRKFKRKNFLKPVFVYAFAAIVTEASGRHVFPEYALQFISQMTADKSRTFYYTICIDLIITGSALISSIIVKTMKRRTLLFSSGFVSFLVLMAVCLYLFLQSKGFISKDSTMLPLMLFAIYFVIVNLGCIPICVTLTGELFPLEHRVISTCIAGALVSIFLLMMSKITPFLLFSINVYGTFSVFGACMAISLFVLYFTLPETKDKTLQEIENYFSYGRYKIVPIDDEEANFTMNDDHLVRSDLKN